MDALYSDYVLIILNSPPDPLLTSLSASCSQQSYSEMINVVYADEPPNESAAMHDVRAGRHPMMF